MWRCWVAMPKRRRARPRQSGKQRGHIMLVEPIQGAPQTVVIEHVRGDPFAQQVLHWLVLKILRHQVQLSITEAKPIQDHRHCRCPDTYTSTALPCSLV